MIAGKLTTKTMPGEIEPDAIDPRSFRDCMGRFTTGVAIATTLTGKEPVAVTVNSLTSVSLAPPMVLFCLDKSSRSLAAFLEARIFALSILSQEQRHLSRRFSTGGNRWDDVALTQWVTGAPVLTRSLAALDCRLGDAHPAGDHLILVGEVLQCGVLVNAPPLVYHSGEYAELPD